MGQVGLRVITGGLIAGGLIAAGLVSGTASAQTLASVKQRSELHCGVSTGVVGFSSTDSQGKYSGLDVDVCRAVAAAILGSGDKVKFTPSTSQQRFPMLQSGEIDILARNTTWTLTRDTVNGFNFAPVTFYDGQGFLVPTKLGVKSAKALNGATVCVQPAPRPSSTWPTISAPTRWNSNRS